jgi:phage recombination protein Bet
MNDTSWTPERIDLVKRTICPKGITDDEFALFLEQCKRSGLDPLLKEAFCVPRRMNIGNKDKPNWVTKHEFQPSEAGMLRRAEGMPDFRGVTASAVYAEDPIEIDADAGEVNHKFNPAKRKGTLVGAWAKVRREGRVPSVVWLDYAAYSQTTPLWAKMPATMIEKCARAAALRKTYPSQFGGMYVAGERPDDVDTSEETEAPAVVERPALPPPAPRETLDMSPQPEKVSLREWTPSEDAHADLPPDPMEVDMQDIERRAEAAQAVTDLAPLKDRALRFADGTPERKRLNKALTAAWKRVSAKTPEVTA